MLLGHAQGTDKEDVTCSPQPPMTGGGVPAATGVDDAKQHDQYSMRHILPNATTAVCGAPVIKRDRASSTTLLPTRACLPNSTPTLPTTNEQ